jgi:hypothetical protein
VSTSEQEILRPDGSICGKAPASFLFSGICAALMTGF